MAVYGTRRHEAHWCQLTHGRLTPQLVDMVCIQDEAASLGERISAAEQQWERVSCAWGVARIMLGEVGRHRVLSGRVIMGHWSEYVAA